MSDKRIPVATLDATCVWSPSKDKAALQALAKLPPGRREYAAALYAREGLDGLLEYCHSVPIAGSGHDFSFRTDPRDGNRLAGIVHTHPGKEKSANHFSPGDVSTADRLNQTSYIRANETGEVRRYDPGESARTPHGDARTTRQAGLTSKGTLIAPANDKDARRKALEEAYEEAARGTTNQR